MNFRFTALYNHHPNQVTERESDSFAGSPKYLYIENLLTASKIFWNTSIFLYMSLSHRDPGRGTAASQL